MKRKATNYIVIHCAATKATMDVGAKEIRSWHKAKGWADIGYHGVIRRDGKFERGRDLEETGAHEQTRNRDSVAICLIGGLSADGKAQDNFTPAQFATLLTKVNEWLAIYPKAKVSGHNFWEPGRGCPSFDWVKWGGKNKLPMVG